MNRQRCPYHHYCGTLVTAREDRGNNLCALVKRELGPPPRLLLLPSIVVFGITAYSRDAML